MMKYIFISCLAFLSLLGAKEHKVVFDCSSSDAYYVKTRMSLIEKTINMIEQQGDKATVAITLHGSCVPMVSKTFEEIVDDNDLPDVQAAQDKLITLINDKRVSVVACAMSLEANAIEKEDVLPAIKISKNSFIDTIAYQNDGYALMTFK